MVSGTRFPLRFRHSGTINGIPLNYQHRHLHALQMSMTNNVAFRHYYFVTHSGGKFSLICVFFMIVIFLCKFLRKAYIDKTRAISNFEKPYCDNLSMIIQHNSTKV
jgi:hypothetical protein